MTQRPLEIGIIGAGHIAAAHVRGWRRASDCRVAGVYDLRPEAARGLASRWRDLKVFATVDELLDACDAVSVCTPPATHPQIAEQAVGAGRHLIVEKPLVVELADWERLRRKLERSEARIAVVHNLKFSLGVRRAKAWIDAGRIGRPLRLDRRFLTSPATDRMLGGEHWSHDLPGGRWFETLPHELYLVHHLLGPLELEHVAVTRSAEAPPGAAADDVVIVLAGADRLATIHYSAHCELNRRELTVLGTTGAIDVEILSDSAALTTTGDTAWRRALGGPRIDAAGRLLGWLPDRARYLSARLRRIDPHARLIGQFALHLQGQAPPPTPIGEIDYVIRLGDRIVQAIDRQLPTS